MDAKTHHNAKQMVAAGHDIAYSAKIVQHDLLLLIESTSQIKDVFSDMDQTADSIIEQLEKTRGVLAEVIATSNTLYHAGLDALKETK